MLKIILILVATSTGNGTGVAIHEVSHPFTSVEQCEEAGKQFSELFEYRKKYRYELPQYYVCISIPPISDKETKNVW